jgi:hypothetical protein
MRTHTVLNAVPCLSLDDIIKDAYALCSGAQDPEYVRDFKFTDNGLWWFVNRVVVPDDSDLRDVSSMSIMTYHQQGIDALRRPLN